MILLYKNAEERVKRLFRTYNNNYGCKNCLENERYDRSISTESLFFRFVDHIQCKDCYIYKMYQELEDYRKSYYDDGK